MPFQSSHHFHLLPPVTADPPPRFTYPFNYAPHPLAKAAAADLQRHLETQTDWTYDFGRGSDGVGSRGKMFGVLVVRNLQGQLGYLAAYSGKLADRNDLPGFVPPVYDTLQQEGFYKIGERRLVRVNTAVRELTTGEELAAARAELASARAAAEAAIETTQAANRAARQARRQRRTAAATTASPTEITHLERELARQSKQHFYALKDLKREWKARVETAEQRVNAITDRIARLKQLRKEYSHWLQHRIFRQYRFLDAGGHRRDLNDIFAATPFRIPPAGAGECAAPKLLQYAYEHDYQPVCMAEFWWGQSPKSAIRRHGNFYFACRGKCKPILGHMLQGLDVDPDPLAVNPARGKELPIVYEDDHLLVVDKPEGFLSVPGKTIEDSVWARVRSWYPAATGPLTVHRLDMSTSGLMVVSKTKEVHKLLQRQFFQRSVRKRYVAILEGEVQGDQGYVNLPLRGDPTDRPRQIVCTEHGKPARTRWTVIERLPEQTRVALWPATGRTHQLRVHCAHPLGLDCPIVGDELYGQVGDRLHLHAAGLWFHHPILDREIALTSTVPF